MKYSALVDMFNQLKKRHLLTSQVKHSLVQQVAEQASETPVDWQAASLLQRAAWVVGELPHEVEETLVKRGGVAELASYAVYVHKRFPEYEPAIALTGRFAVAYAQRVLGLSECNVFAWIQSMKEQQ